MASWQFDLVLVPRVALATLPGDRTVLEDSRPYWLGHAASALRTALASLGEQQPTWTPSIVMWGRADATCALLLTEGEIVEELRVRVDMHEPRSAMLQHLLDIARARDWRIITCLGTVVEPDLEALLEASSKSPAARFVSDPRAFLDDLQSGTVPPGETDVPADLACPGTIVRRQTTFWELRADTTPMYRVHFKDKVEFAFAGAEYSAVEVATRHPLLVAYEEPSRSLYFSGAPVDPRLVAATLERALLDASNGWRGLTGYAGSVDKVEHRLRVGHGLLMEAPESVCAAAAALLEGAGVGTSILGKAPARPGKRVLLAGQSYVIASAFFFERRLSI